MRVIMGMGMDANNWATQQQFETYKYLAHQVDHLISQRVFEEVFFNNEMLYKNGGAGLREFMTIEGKMDVFNSFAACLVGNHVEIPKDGIPGKITPLEKFFVQSVLDAIHEGALKDAVVFLREQHHGVHKNGWWKYLAYHFYCRCCRTMKEFGW